MLLITNLAIERQKTKKGNVQNTPKRRKSKKKEAESPVPPVRRVKERPTGRTKGEIT